MDIVVRGLCTNAQVAGGEIQMPLMRIFNTLFKPDYDW